MDFYNLLFLFPSHPTWVRGLKQLDQEDKQKSLASHPTWVRGLKPLTAEEYVASNLSHPTWVRGLKLIARVEGDKMSRRTLRGCVD